MARGTHCDPMTCDHATFPKTDALDGACRREVSLYCTLLGRLVPKHTRCLAERAGVTDNQDEGKKQ